MRDGPRVGRPTRMAEDTTPDKGITSPSVPTHEATSPPGNQEADQADVEKGEDKLGQAGAGH